MVATTFPVPTLEVALDPEHPEAEVISADEWETWFTQWGQQMALEGSPIGAYELSLKLTTDGAIAALNHQFRQLDQPTDVLSFAALETDFPQIDEILTTEPLYLGDIIISLDTAARQAIEAGHSLRWETAWLAAHGFLHLLGWDHPDDPSLVEMLDKQSELLTAAGLKSEEVG
ncbi:MULTISPECIES: rRNA maturation RNase YbeY [Cyanophyceae]|uniref:rRNA maturation RNase YbeY n=1 Tax=Cyanophyceae TaxID=3028117 RepID=UPI00168364AC|nr:MULTISPECIES: rRNA maturation RNase YbeY [Cyanophyceae]MBD1915258.1 rRNA maturation RNase YbeY [Phormidium sp. FACHB-77]MBD2032465.1 rRNA maturation RNase YbeY [Phormidium sp. FACHB-322]MBD2051004.1 rRNA maturation RNase YbeY [Leptolyngbya sp. FACHB-60]